MALARRPPPELFKLALNRWTQPFWEATRQHRLLLARCADCGHARLEGGSPRQIEPSRP